MKYEICIAKTTLVFYLILTPFIMYGSIYNLIGILTGTGSVMVFGAFSMFGFVLLPLAIFSTYKNKKCTVSSQGIHIGKTGYCFSDYIVAVKDYELPLKNRPVFSLFRKKYHKLIICGKQSNRVEREESLDVFKKDIKKLKQLL